MKEFKGPTEDPPEFNGKTRQADQVIGALKKIKQYLDECDNAVEESNLLKDGEEPVE
ncbi:hypothetical protein HDU97_009483, partial [Phlyctochytrium planicorne]